MTSSPEPTVRAVWTDFGGVLTPPIAHTFLSFCTAMRLDPEPLMKAIMKVTATYQTDDIMLPLDTPLVTEQEWLRQVADVLRADSGVEVRLTTLADAWFDGRETNTAWVEHLRELRARGVFVGLLSNMVPAWDAHWRRMVPASEFDDVLLSFEIGHRKPARQAFDLAVRRSGIAAEHSVFVDDLDKNCAGAQAAGWRAIHFTDTAAAIAALDALTGQRTGAAR